MPQVLLIKKRFASLDMEGKGYVTVEDVINGVPSMSKHPLACRLLEQNVRAYELSTLPMAAKQDTNIQVVEFQAFVRTLDHFSS